MNIVLLSTYDLGRQPFGLASPAGSLRAAGHTVTQVDLSLAPLPSLAVREAGMVAIHLPMHTATRLAIPVIQRLRLLSPSVQICAYGLYASLNEARLREAGVNTILGGEFEPQLRALANGSLPPSGVSLNRIQFNVPDRQGLPALSRYAKLHIADATRVVGYTEASRGCKHLCRHCPVVPVYQGVFRVVQQDVVLEDIRRQVASGAGHVTFGDPDFFNGPTHASRIVEELHREFPQLSYDVTIKVEHLLRYRELLPLLHRTGCVLVTTAVESVQDEVLEKLDKGHTRDDFTEAVRLCRGAGLTLNPTFIPFTPWTTLEGYRDLLSVLVNLDLVDNVSPVQLALRLLIPQGSRLLELEDIRAVAGPFSPSALLHPWKHEDPELDTLAATVLQLVNEEQRQRRGRREIFHRLWQTVFSDAPLPDNFHLMPRATVPYLDEPWYC